MPPASPTGSSIFDRIAAATGGILLNQLLRAVQQLLWVPLFLFAWGKQGYGEWLTLVSLVGYGALSDLGVQVYWANLLTGLEVREDFPAYRRVFRSGIALFSVSAIVVLAIAVVLLWVMNPADYFHFDFLSRGTTWLVVVLLLAAGLTTIAGDMVRAVYRTTGNFPRVLRFQNARDLAVLIVVSAALLASVKPLGIALTLLGTAMAMLFWAMVDAGRRFPKLVDFRLHEANRKTMWDLVLGGSFFFVGRLSSLALIQTPPLIAAKLLGPASAAMFVAARTLTNLALQIGGSITRSAIPEYSRLEARGNHEGLSSVLQGTTGVVALASGFASIVLFGVGAGVFEFWTGGVFAKASLLIRLLSISVLLESLRGLLHTFLVGCNRNRSVALASGGTAVVALLMMWATVSRLGVGGLPFGLIVGTLAVGGPVAILSVLVIIGNTQVRKVLSINGKVAALFAVVCAGILAIEHSIPTVGASIAITALGGLVFAVLGYHWTVSTEDHARLRGALRHRCSRALARLR